MAFQAGQAATWLHIPRGGYGFATPVNATVLAVTPKRVRIRVARRDGRLVERWVAPTSLRAKGQPVGPGIIVA